MSRAIAMARRSAHLSGDRAESSKAPREVFERRAHLLASFFIIAAFGPYIWVGIRTEQAAIYVLSALFVARYFSTMRWRMSITGVAALWGAILLISLFAAIAPPENGGSWLPGVDALAAPLLILVFVATASASVSSSRELMLTVQKWTLVMLGLNALLALLMTRVDITANVSEIFWSIREPGVKATGEYAASVGRIGGVFNTPLAAGTAYSIGLAVAAYLTSSSQWRPWKTYVSTLLVFVGGMLCQSKVFVFAGLPVFVGLLVVSVLRRRPWRGFLVVGGGIAASLALTRTLWWNDKAVALWTRFFGSSDDIVKVYSAGRFNDDAPVQVLIRQILDTSPINGYGVSLTIGPLDTALAEMLARAGILGVLLLIGCGVCLFAMWLSNPRRHDPELWWLIGGLLFVLLAAAAGGPFITQNRSGTILLLNVTLALSAWEDCAAGDGRRTRVGSD